MIRRATCEMCGVRVEYDDRSIWEGNRDFEDVLCPKCGNVLDRVFTDLCPTVRIIGEARQNKSDNDQ